MALTLLMGRNSGTLASGFAVGLVLGYYISSRQSS